MHQNLAVIQENLGTNLGKALLCLHLRGYIVRHFEKDCTGHEKTGVSFKVICPHQLENALATVDDVGVPPPQAPGCCSICCGILSSMGTGTVAWVAACWLNKLILFLGTKGGPCVTRGASPLCPQLQPQAPAPRPDLLPPGTGERGGFGGLGRGCAGGSDHVTDHDTDPTPNPDPGSLTSARDLSKMVRRTRIRFGNGGHRGT